MNLSVLEWSMMIGMVLFMGILVFWTRQFSKGVSDFLAANRCAGRYLLCVASGIAGTGAIYVLASFEVTYQVGFAANWWGAKLMMPISLVLMLSGWVVYRFRETRALTLAQFLEMRYSRRLRIFAGVLCFISGLLNFGVFPAIAGHFFVGYCGLPEVFSLLGFQVRTLVIVMLVLLAVSLFFTLASGQIGILLTDFLQGMFFNISLVLILVALLVKFSLSDVFSAMLQAPAGQSMVNPFNISKIPEFNFWYYMLGIFNAIYAQFAWQGSAGYNSAAITPHEAKMAGVVGSFRSWAFGFGLVMLPLCAYTLLHHPKYAGEAAQVHEILNQIPNAELRSQMLTPAAMTIMLPSGLVGCFAAIMLAAFIATTTSYMHSWGSIFIQDIVLPLRKKPFEQKVHLAYLRWSIVGVAAFGFVFSMVFTQTMKINLYFLLSGAVWVGGAGSLIIGGLYWKRGTTAAAWTALILGATLPLIVLAFDQVWHHVYGTQFVIGPKLGTFLSAVTAIVSYVLVSLLKPEAPFNLDRMLHRGDYAVAGDERRVDTKSKFTLKKMFGYTPELSRGDRFIFMLTIGKFFLFFGLFVVMTAAGLAYGLSEKAWATYQRYFLWFQIVLSFAFAVWITVGGFLDLKQLFLRLRSAGRDSTDDGRVDAECEQKEVQASAR